MVRQKKQCIYPWHSRKRPINIRQSYPYKQTWTHARTLCYLLPPVLQRALARLVDRLDAPGAALLVDELGVGLLHLFWLWCWFACV